MVEEEVEVEAVEEEAAAVEAGEAAEAAEEEAVQEVEEAGVHACLPSWLRSLPSSLYSGRKSCLADQNPEESSSFVRPEAGCWGHREPSGRLAALRGAQERPEPLEPSGGRTGPGCPWTGEAALPTSYRAPTH